MMLLLYVPKKMLLDVFKDQCYFMSLKMMLLDVFKDQCYFMSLKMMLLCVSKDYVTLCP